MSASSCISVYVFIIIISIVHDRLACPYFDYVNTAATFGSSQPPFFIFRALVCRRVVVVRGPGLDGRSQERLLGNGLVLSILGGASLA